MKLPELSLRRLDWVGSWIVALSMAWNVALAAEESSKRVEKSAAASAPYGLSERTYWTTSQFRGRPEPPPPYRVQRAFSKLNFNHPTVITNAPGTERLFVGEQGGKVYSIPNDPGVAAPDLFLDTHQLVKHVNATQGVSLSPEAFYGLTFDPNFIENRYCYVCYVVRNNKGSGGAYAEGTRVTRLTVSRTEPPVCDVASEQLIIAWLQGGHNGGCLKFGPDGCLYISSGDGSPVFPPDGLNSGQNMSSLLSKVLRIDVRNSHSGRPYTIPSDNPFVSTPGVRGETWAYGLRNPWKMSFDRKSGELWLGDVGWELWELVYRVRPGDNYGWSLVEGRQPVHVERQRGPTPIVPPTIEIPHTEGASITGGFVYRGKKFPELYGQYVFGDWETRRVWGVNVDGPQLGERKEIVEPVVRIVDFAEDNSGELYLLDYDDGTVFTLVPNDAKPSDTPFPRKLSETGIFSSVAEHRVAPGVVPFSIQSEQWADHALSERFVAVPGRESIKLHGKTRQLPGTMFSRIMDFPLDSLLIKTLALEMQHGDPASRRRIETQVLHFDGREWQGYSYEWNDAQTDATLVERTGKRRQLTVDDPHAPGGKREQSWWFPSRMECIRCHNPWTEYTLAFTVPQLNRAHDYPQARDNQLRTLRHIGLFEPPVEPRDPLDPYKHAEPAKSPELLPRYADPFDTSVDINARARSYLHVNCAHCHRFNGGGSSHIYLSHELSLKDTKSLALRPTQGTFGIHDAQLLAPGDPYRSVLYYRLAKIGPGHMPHIGAKLIDERGVKLVHDWIQQLPTRYEDASQLEHLATLDEPSALEREAEEAPRARWLIALRQAQQAKRALPNDDDLAHAAKQAAEQAAQRAQSRREERPRIIGEFLATPIRAAMLASALRENRLPAATQREAIELAMKVSDAAIRDLFESFVPDEQRTKRIGESFRGDELLALKGDAEQGRRLFHESNTVQCRNCHRIRGQGIELGPELTQIGKKLDRAKLLESITQPSLNIEPKYALWLVETKSGLVLSGLLVSKDEQAIVLRDAQNKEHRVAAAEVEGLYPQRKSFMPELLLRDFTPQQVADLLAYLSTLK